MSPLVYPSPLPQRLSPSYLWVMRDLFNIEVSPSVDRGRGDGKEKRRKKKKRLVAPRYVNLSNKSWVCEWDLFGTVPNLQGCELCSEAN